MSEAKREILNRVRTALGSNRPSVDATNKPMRNYRTTGKRSSEQRVQLLADRLDEYKATVQRVTQKTLADAIANACQKESVEKLAIPPELPSEWIPAAVESLHDASSNPLSNHQLDQSDGVFTACALAVAETGTIILDGGKGQGRRALTLVPDYHLCVVKEAQIVELLPEAIAYFDDEMNQEAPPLTFISGPSATSDIELNRVEGVHGPRRLEVLIVGEDLTHS